MRTYPAPWIGVWIAKGANKTRVIALHVVVRTPASFVHAYMLYSYTYEEKILFSHTPLTFRNVLVI